MSKLFKTGVGFLAIVFALFISLTGFTSHKIKQPINEIKWSAQDSVKIDKKAATVSLYGKAKFTCTDFSLSADEMLYDKKQQKVIAKNYVVTAGRNKNSKGGYAEFYIEK